MLVVDASFVIQAALSKAGFDPLQGEDLLAPRLLWSEVPSVLHEMKWRSRASSDLVDLALSRFLEAPITSRHSAKIPRLAWELAEKLGWAKTYDAEYVALARMMNCGLLTIDARLKWAAGKFVKTIGPADL